MSNPLDLTSVYVVFDDNDVEPFDESPNPNETLRIDYMPAGVIIEKTYDDDTVRQTWIPFDAIRSLDITFPKPSTATLPPPVSAERVMAP